MANSDFADYYDLEGNEIFVAGTTASDSDTSEYQSEEIPYLINPDSEEQAGNFIAKNEVRAVQVESDTLTNLYKVPASNIYFWKKTSHEATNITIDNVNLYDNGNPHTRSSILGDTSKPFTFVIPHGDLTIEGSFDDYNAMFIVQQ